MKAYRVVDYIQWVWKKVYNIDKSKSEIRRDLNQGSIRLNDKKLTVDDVIVLNTKDPN
jgi:hypothetical protein